jgi:hypothetical protein
MLLLVGLLPIKDLPLSLGKVDLAGQDRLRVDSQTSNISRGATAMMSAAWAVCQEYGLESPMGVIAGDIGTGAGSVEIYESGQRYYKMHPGGTAGSNRIGGIDNA